MIPKREVVKKEKERPAGIEDNESVLSSSDDEEIQQYLLNDEEKVIKVTYSQ